MRYTLKGIEVYGIERVWSTQTKFYIEWDGPEGFWTEEFDDKDEWNRAIVKGQWE